MKSYHSHDKLLFLSVSATLVSIIFYSLPLKNINSVSQPAAIADANSQLIAYYTFDDGTAIDFVGGNNGALNGTTPMPGKIGGAIQFDGVDDSVLLGSPVALKLSNNFTWSYWMKAAKAGGNTSAPIRWSGTGGYFSKLSGSKVMFGRAGVANDVTSSTSFNLETWYHVVTTVDDLGKVTLYVNGVKDTTGTTVVTSPSGNLTFGAGSTDNFAGLIDDVRFYNRVLSAEEVTQIFSDVTPEATTPAPATSTESSPTTPLASGHIYIAQTTQGDDSGSDCSNAHSMAWVNEANSVGVPKNWGNSPGQISPGITVHLCGNITSELFIQKDGAQGQPLTIFFEPNAKMTSPAFNRAIRGATRSWIVIDGGQNGIIENTDNGTALANKVATIAIDLYGGSAGNNTVKNLTIRNLYVRTPYSTDKCGCGTGIKFSGSNILIKNNYISHGVGLIVGIFGTGSASNLVVDSNTLYGTNHGITLGTGGVINPFYSNITISNNKIDGMDIWDVPAGDLGFHRNGIFMFNESPDKSGSISNVKIFNNFIGPGANPQSSQLLTAGTGGIFLIAYTPSQLRDVYIFNNVFSLKPPISWSNGYIAGGGSNTIIANNTFIGWGETTRGISSGGPGMRVYNNLLYGISSVALNYKNTSSDMISDYNLFFGLNGKIGFGTIFQRENGSYGNVLYDTFIQWQKAPGLWDAHSSLLDPKLVDPSPAHGNYRLQDSSPAIGGGINLTSYCSSVPEMCQDFDGNSRPSNGPWTIGAYEYNSGQPSTPIADTPPVEQAPPALLIETPPQEETQPTPEVEQPEQEQPQQTQPPVVEIPQTPSNPIVSFFQPKRTTTSNPYIKQSTQGNPLPEEVTTLPVGDDSPFVFSERKSFWQIIMEITYNFFATFKLRLYSIIR